MSTHVPIILPPEGDYSLKGACLPIFRAIRSIGSAITDDLPDFLSECAQEISDAWDESSKPEENPHA
jgi:predicted RNA-binding Zn ribbon-like protein